MRNGTKIRQRGRPREFDSDAAIGAAKSIFLRNGYSNTTLDQLSTAMRMNRPSLYNAFTDKEALYQRALQTYADDMTDIFRDALEDESNLHKAVLKLYATALDAYYPETGEAVGCMVACTAIAEAPGHPLIRQHAKAIMDGIDALVARRVARAVNEGQLPPRTNVKVHSRLIVGVLHTLAMRSRAGTPRKVLDEIAIQASHLLAPPT